MHKVGESILAFEIPCIIILFSSTSPLKVLFLSSVMGIKISVEENKRSHPTYWRRQVYIIQNLLKDTTQFYSYLPMITKPVIPKEPPYMQKLTLFFHIFFFSHCIQKGRRFSCCPGVVVKENLGSYDSIPFLTSV